MSSYRSYIDQMAMRNPSLATLSSFLRGNSHLGPCANTTSLIEFDIHGQRSVHEITNAQDIALKIAHLEQQPSQDAGGMIIIVEDPSATDIDSLGPLLDIDPVFFCGHISSSYQDIERSPSAPLLGLLPSRIISKEYVNIHYQRVLDLGHESSFHRLPYKMTIPGNNPRTVRRLPPLSGRQLGLARTCCSVLRKELENGAWICLILADATTSDIVYESKGASTGNVPSIKTPQVPRRIVPEDFRDLPAYSTFQEPVKGGVPRTASLRADLLSFFQEPLPGSGSPKPQVLPLAYYPLQIALAEWMLYVQLMSRYIKLYEYSFEAVQNLNGRSEIQDLIELHRWRRRSSQSLHKLRMARLFVEHWHKRACPPCGAWDFVVSDFRHVEDQIAQHARSLESLNPILMSVVQLVDSHKSITEASDVKRLTYIAILFIPLSFIAGLFSMGEDFLPGTNGFWLYWATSIPITALVVVASLVPSAGKKLVKKTGGVMARWIQRAHERNSLV